MDRSESRNLYAQVARLMLGAVVLVLPLVLVMGAGYADQPNGTLELVPAQDHNYVGVAGCQMCHRSPAKGNQFGAWSEGPHTGAYATLATDASKAIATEKGLGDPQKAAECLECHATAANLPAGRKAATWKIEDGVGCESCHGAGSDYKAITVMRDHAASVAAGLVEISEATCTKCHNERSPTFKGFNYEEAYKKVAHPDPSK
jgi:hypothetical protein